MVGGKYNSSYCLISQTIYVNHMGRLSKRRAHLSNLYNAKRQQLLAQQSLNISENELHAVHWKGFSEDEDCDIEITDIDNDFFDEANITVDKFQENI
jgi:hypothetical protein